MARSGDADCRARVAKAWLDCLSMAETYFAHELKALLIVESLKPLVNGRHTPRFKIEFVHMHMHQS